MGIDAAIDGHASGLSEIVIDRLQGIGYRPAGHWPEYLRAAFKAHPPVYGVAWYGELYYELASDDLWLGATILRSGAEESEGVRRLSELLRALPEEAAEHEPKVQRHIADEKRHSWMFLDLFEKVYPDGSYPETLRHEMEELSQRLVPQARTRKITADEFLREVTQINLGEIKNLVNVNLMKLAVDALRPNREDIQAILDRLLQDELHHIRFTAEIIDTVTAPSKMQYLRETFIEATRLFNDETLRDLRFELDADEARLTYGLAETTATA